MKDVTKGSWGACLGLVAFVAISGCAGPSGPASRPLESAKTSPVAAPQESQPRELRKLKFGYPTISGSIGVMGLMKEAGLFAKNGFDVEILLIQPSTNLVAAMVAGEVPIIHSGAQAIIQANLAGADTVMVSGGISALAASLMGPPSIRSPADLKGKRIGISRFGTVDDFASRYALRAWGLNPQTEVTLVQTGGQAERLMALETGAIDVASTSPPFTVAARRLGFVEVADLGDVGINVNTAGIATTREFARREPDVVLRVVRTYAEALRLFRADRELAIKVMAQYTGIEGEEELADAYERYATKYASEIPRISTEGLQLLLDYLAETDPRAKTARPEDFTEPRFMKELEDSGFIRQLWR